jgi:hypothetical protein
MHPRSVHASLKALGYLVLLLMAGAIVYGGTMSIVHWTGIGV